MYVMVAVAVFTLDPPRSYPDRPHIPIALPSLAVILPRSTVAVTVAGSVIAS
jgi:hypothetical protein